MSIVLRVLSRQGDLFPRRTLPRRVTKNTSATCLSNTVYWFRFLTLGWISQHIPQARAASQNIERLAKEGMSLKGSAPVELYLSNY